MDRLSILNDDIARFEEHYSSPVEGGLCRTPNVRQMAAYEGWIKERDSYTTRGIDKEIAKLRKAEAELLKRRDAMLIEEAIASVPVAVTAADQIARALIAVNVEHEIPLGRLFGVQTSDVNTAGLIQLAEWRDPETIQMFLKNGANVNFKDYEGFSVLDMVLQGHDSYWRKSNWNPEVLKVLTDYNVDRTGVKEWVVNECCAEAPQFVHDFLNSVPV